MPEQVQQEDRPELGFVDVGQYLSANQESIDRQLQGARTDANSIAPRLAPLWNAGGSLPYPGSSASQTFGGIGQQQQGLEGITTGSVPGVADAPGPAPDLRNQYSEFRSAGTEADRLRGSFATQAGLAGSGRLGEGLTGRGPGGWNAMLAYAKYGPQYQELADSLKQYGPDAVEKRIAGAEQVRQQPSQQQPVYQPPEAPGGPGGGGVLADPGQGEGGQPSTGLPSETPPQRWFDPDDPNNRPENQPWWWNSGGG